MVGETSQLTATAVFSDGTQEDVTSQAIWTSFTSEVPIAAGLVTAATACECGVTATYRGVTGQVSLRIAQPAGNGAGDGAGADGTGAGDRRGGGSGDDGSDNSGGGSDNGDGPTVQNLSIDGIPSVVVGATRQLTATARLSDGTSTEVTSLATWTSSAPGIATVFGGLLTGIGPGASTITAAFGGQIAQASVTANAAAADLVGLEVTLDANILGTGATASLDFAQLLNDPVLDLGVFGLYSDGSRQDVTSAAAVTTSDPLLRVDAPGVIDLAGALINALVDPNHTINVAYGGFTANVIVHLSVANLGSLPITGLQLTGLAPNQTLAVGTKLPPILALLAGGNQLLVASDTPGVNWTVAPRGLLTGLLGTLGQSISSVLDISSGTLHGVSFGLLDPVLTLLNGVLTVDLSAVANGVTATVPVNVPIP
jgi:hypothetical protein